MLYFVGLIVQRNIGQGDWLVTASIATVKHNHIVMSEWKLGWMLFSLDNFELYITSYNSDPEGIYTVVILFWPAKCNQHLLAANIDITMFS